MGLRQCCVMTSKLFKLYMDGIVMGLNECVLRQGLKSLRANGRNWPLSQLLLADDEELVSDFEKL